MIRIALLGDLPLMKANMKRRRGLLFVAAALASSGSHSWAFVPSTPDARGTAKKRGVHTFLFRTHPLQNPVLHQTVDNARLRQRNITSTRLYSSGKNDGESGGIFSKLGKVAKSVLPTKIFGSDKEKQELARRKEVKNQVSGGLNTMLKDAPLGVRMMGKMISPLVSGIASTLAETIAEQQQTTESIIDEARTYLLRDPAVTTVLGTSISLGSPFSQSSSTSSMNGRTQTRIELIMPVSGPLVSGTVQVLATQNGILQMQLDAGGRRVDVSLTSGQGWSNNGSSPLSNSSSSKAMDDSFIEAEIIDKTTK